MITGRFTFERYGSLRSRGKAGIENVLSTDESSHLLA